MINNRLTVLLVIFTGLMITVYSAAITCTPRADWVTISLDNPPAPLPDPPETI